MALSGDLARAFETGPKNTLPTAASATIYRGSAVGDSSGYARALTAGDPFRGFADAKVDNSAGSAGDKNVDVIEEGYVQVTLSSIAITDVGKPVYMSDDGTFTLTASTNSLVGKVYRYVTTDTCIVKFGGLVKPATTLTAVTTVSSTDTTPVGYTTTAQADAIVTQINNIIAFLGEITHI